MNLDQQPMKRAIELAARGQGHVEPNPMVGCVIVRAGKCVAEGWHKQFGGPHAEIEALRKAGDLAQGATMYVTLEPCCHAGKTPPCTDAIIQAGIQRVVVAQADPFPKVQGGGLRQLRAAGIAVELGLLETDAAELNKPYLMLIQRGRPWIIAKWAMTLDGRIASHTGHSQWISCEASRKIVHQLRGRVDGIMVGRATVAADDPRLTARPPGCRVASRVVLDSRASLAIDSRLVQSIDIAPVLVAVGPDADAGNCQKLTKAGCEIIACDAMDLTDRLWQLLQELGRRRMTNLLVEGGSQIFGSLFDLRVIDEVHVFVAPKLAGGGLSPGAIAGRGLDHIPSLPSLDPRKIEVIGDDVYLTGRVRNSLPSQGQ